VKGKDHFGGLGLYGRTVLKQILNEVYMKSSALE
jgi:hypothetical protein